MDAAVVAIVGAIAPQDRHPTVDDPAPSIAHVATISAQDRMVGDLIAEAFDKVGKDGVITVEESPDHRPTELELTEGMQFDKGFISALFRH